MTRVFTLAAIATSTIFLAADQTRDVQNVTRGNAQIAGTIVTSLSDEAPVPLRRAIVRLTSDDGTTRLQAVTDDAGRFAFTSLPASRYTLSASKSGYVPMAYGSKRPGGSGTPVGVAEGQNATVTIALPGGSVLTGTVRDGLGRPLPDVSVSALRYVFSAQTGGRMLDSPTVGSAGQIAAGYSPDAFPGTAVTDDRGTYRIYGLAAGEYLVQVSVRPPRGSPSAVTDVYQITAGDLQRAQQLLRGARGESSADAGANTGLRVGMRVDYAPVYHPGGLSAADATTIALGRAEERAGVDVVIRLVPTATVSGFVTAPDGSGLARAQVSVMAPEQSPFTFSVFKSVWSGADGEFVIAGVPPGRYQVQAGHYPSLSYGTSEVVVEGRDVQTSVTLVGGPTVSGRVVFDGKSPVPPFSAVSPYLSRPDFIIGGPRYEMSADGRFSYTSVPPGRYQLRNNGRPPAGWVLRSVMLNGVDISDVPLVVKQENIEGIVFTLSDRPAEISGTLLNADGRPAPDYVLVVFAADSRFWVPRSRRTQQVRPDVNGRFLAKDLTAGDYLIAAVTDIEDGQWNDPAFLAALAASGPVKITLAEGDKKVQDIRIGGREPRVQ